jgi:predicted phosphodiesterase
MKRMGKIAILSDVHSNLPALTAVLREVQSSGAERIVFLGDVVGYGASPAECVTWVRKLGGVCVMGNHEESMGMVLRRGRGNLESTLPPDDYLAGLVHSAKSLSDDQAQWAAGLPYELSIPGARIAHGSLDEPAAWHYISDDESAEPTLEILRQGDLRVGFFGHTHEQGIFADVFDALEWLDAARVCIPAGMACAVTVGSVGQPRHETDRRACWVLWDSATRVVEFRRTEFNRIEAAQQIAKAGLPMDAALRLLTDPERAFLVR